MIKLRCRTNQIRSNRYCRVLIAAPACYPSRPSNRSRCRNLSRSRSNEANHDGRNDAWDDVGDGADLGPGRRRPGPLGGCAHQVPSFWTQGRPTVSKFPIVALVTFASLSSALAESGDRNHQDDRSAMLMRSDLMAAAADRRDNRTW